MIIVTRAEVTEAEIDGIREHVERCGVRSYLTTTAGRTVIGCLVELDEGEAAEIERLPGVETTAAWHAPYRLASRQLAPPGGRTVIRLGDDPRATVGGRELLVIAGPCSVEERDTLCEAAWGVRRAGAGALRGGAFKPRTSPYAFQGLGEEGLELLAEARLGDVPRKDAGVVAEAVDGGGARRRRLPRHSGRSLGRVAREIDARRRDALPERCLCRDTSVRDGCDVEVAERLERRPKARRDNDLVGLQLHPAGPRGPGGANDEAVAPALDPLDSRVHHVRARAAADVLLVRVEVADAEG